MRKAREITKEGENWIKDNLRYDPETGDFWWTKQISGRGHKRELNRPAGCDSLGYLVIALNVLGYKTTLSLHRAAWFFYHGVWPKDCIDHINGVRNDNRVVNLREATNAENLRNRKLQVGGSSKYKGVHWFKRDCNWRARITISGKRIHLGIYHNEEEAALAYNKAALEYFGEYAKINIIEPLDTGMTNTYISSSSGELTC